MKTRAVRLYGESDLRLEEFDMGELKDDEILMELITDSVCMSTYKESIQGANIKLEQNIPCSQRSISKVLWQPSDILMNTAEEQQPLSKFRQL